MLLADGDFGGLFRGALVVLAVIVAGWVAVTTIRKRLKEDDAPLGTGFTLADLRELHRSGKMTTEEFEKAKAMLVSSMAKPKPGTEVKPRNP